MFDPGDIDTLTARSMGLDDDDRCPVCGGELTSRTIYGRYREWECLNIGCGFEVDNAPPEAHFGSGYD